MTGAFREGCALVRRARATPGPETCAIAVMAKASTSGRAKTRLVPPLTRDQAADLNSAFLRDMADKLAVAGTRACIAPFFAFGPPGSAPFFEELITDHVGLLEVWFSDFGECLYRTAHFLLDLGYGSVCVLNSDSPTLPTSCLVEAAHALSRAGDRAVLGPSTDGGYYLLGLKRLDRRLFKDIAWSTDTVAARTLERADDIGLDVVTLASWYDVDDAQSLSRLADELTSTDVGAGSDPDHRPHHTASVLDRIGLHSTAQREAVLRSLRIESRPA